MIKFNLYHKVIFLTRKASLSNDGEAFIYCTPKNKYSVSDYRNWKFIDIANSTFLSFHSGIWSSESLFAIRRHSALSA